MFEQEGMEGGIERAEEGHNKKEKFKNAALKGGRHTWNAKQRQGNWGCKRRHGSRQEGGETEEGRGKETKLS